MVRTLARRKSQRIPGTARGRARRASVELPHRVWDNALSPATFTDRAPAIAHDRLPMIDLSQLKTGMKGSSGLLVGVEHTAPRIGSGRVPVLATPVMINVIEAAALAAVEHLLPTGHQSLGIHLDVRHFAATPVGMRIGATAELIKVDGRTLVFHVEAHDEKESIGNGSHERVVVNVARFDQRIQKKLGG